ncbi:MAG: diacylglycerol/lipid kinase family protein [Gaiellaceae bacterium]
MTRALLIVNPTASRVTPELTDAVAETLAAGGEVETVATQGPGHARELAEASTGYDRVYVFSGDGGFNETVNGMRGDVPIGFVPGGGTSVLPRALGLPHDALEAARILARTSAVRRISLGRANGRRFTFSAGLGLDAELVRAVDGLGRHATGRPGDVAFAAMLARLLIEHRARFRPSMTVRGRGRVAFALAANCDPYPYLGRLPVHVAPLAHFEDGLDVVAPRGLAPWQLPRLAAWVLGWPGQHHSAEVLYLRDRDLVEIDCDDPTPLQVDGEDLGDVTEAVFEADRDALSVLVSGTNAP